MKRYSKKSSSAFVEFVPLDKTDKLVMLIVLVLLIIGVITIFYSLLTEVKYMNLTGENNRFLSKLNIAQWLCIAALALYSAAGIIRKRVPTLLSAVEGWLSVIVSGIALLCAVVLIFEVIVRS